MIRVFFKIAVIFFSLSFVSCSQKEEQLRIRIVDLQGKPGRVITKVPNLNVQALAEQGKLSSPQPIIPQEKSQSPQKNIATKQDFGAVSSQIIQDTLQAEQSPEFRQKVSDNSAVKMNSNEIQEIQYDLSEGGLKDPRKLENAKSKPSSSKKYVMKKNEGKKITQTAAKKDQSSKVYSQKKRGLYVQVGSFSNSSNAKRRMKKIEHFDVGRIEQVRRGKTIYRVLLGPFASKKQADSMLRKVKKSGYAAVLVRNR